MSKIIPITCGLPFCQRAQEDQTKLSIGLRITAKHWDVYWQPSVPLSYSEYLD